jgi:hypothetical protein
MIDGQFPFIPYFPGNPAYLPNSPISKWIGPVADGLTAVGGPVGNWVYETTFDLVGTDVSSVELTGRLASDNASEIFLNGANTGEGACCIDHFTSFRIASGFAPGINRLDFLVNNADCGPSCFNPTGLRVEFGEFGHGIPEPLTFVLLAGGLLGIESFRRCNRA